LANSSNAWSITLDASHVYWTTLSSTGGVFRTVLAGGTVETIATAQDMPHGLGVSGSTVYWGHSDGVRKKTSGVPKTTNLVTGTPYVGSVALDGTHVYFSSSTNPGSVSKVLQAGGSVATLASGLNQPNGVALDDSAVYFSVYGTGEVQKIGKDGFGSQLLASGYGGPIDIDISGEYAFFTNGIGHLVVQVPKTGGAAITRMNSGFPYSLKASNGIIYWSDLTDNRIYAMVE